MSFKVFGDAVNRRFLELAGSATGLFVTDGVDDLFDAYLSAFPEGTNPLFRKRTEHDCSCCKHFIRTIGRVVALADDGSFLTVWDVTGLPPHYQVVADRLAARVRQSRLGAPFLVSPEHSKFGAQVTRDLSGGTLLSFDHFYASVPARYQTHSVDQVRGDRMARAAVFERGLREFSCETLDTVLELIDENQLYRGAENRAIVQEFRDLAATFDPARPHTTVWKHLASPVAHLRNTAMGELLQSIARGEDLERAVAAYERMVAPQNYRRPKAVVSQRMVDDAMRTVESLGLANALPRRFARLSDVSVNDVYFVDNRARSRMAPGRSVHDLLLAAAEPRGRNLDHAENIAIGDFMLYALPGATKMQLLLERSHLTNFISLTAPMHASAPPLFMWHNNFAWTYDGDVADSIKDRVKAAGGRTDSALRVSLGWYNFDDLDLHCILPNGTHVYYGNKLGILDVDMNVSPTTRKPVENLSFDRLQDGVYKVYVEMFTSRESSDTGFEIEVEDFTGVRSFRGTRARDRSFGGAQLFIEVRGGKVERLDVTPGSGLTPNRASTEKWGVRTGELVTVNSLMLSPNHWGVSSQGAKHYIFALSGCLNPDKARGIYNEFLRPELQAHRKVFELLGSLSKCDHSDDQVSGVGFTASRYDQVRVVVNDKRAYNILF
jgi:hypothetical protein